MCSVYFHNPFRSQLHLELYLIFYLMNDSIWFIVLLTLLTYIRTFDCFRRFSHLTVAMLQHRYEWDKSIVGLILCKHITYFIGDFCGTAILRGHKHNSINSKVMMGTNLLGIHLLSPALQSFEREFLKLINSLKGSNYTNSFQKVLSEKNLGNVYFT